MIDPQHPYTTHPTYTGQGCAMCGKNEYSHQHQPGMICKWCGCKIPTDGGNYLLAPCNKNPNHAYAHEFEWPKKEG